MDKQQLVRRLNALKTEANNWKSAWMDIQTYILPSRGQFDDSQPNSGKLINHKTVLDGHAGRCSRTLAAGMTSGLTSPSRPWFKLGIADQDLLELESVKEWLDTTQQRMMTVFSKSNIYGVLNSTYSEIGTFGTAATAIVEDLSDIIRAKSFTIGEYFIGTGLDGRVNTFAREYWMTVAQIVEDFGIENVSTHVKSLFDNRTFDTWIKVCHLIQPNLSKDPQKKDNKNMAFTSAYWESGMPEDKLLREGGFREFPILAPRWDVVGADVYGRGETPGWNVLGDVKMLQKMQRNKLVALDKLTDPPIQIKGDMIGEANMLPGGITRFSAGPDAGATAAYQVNPNLQALEATIQQTKMDISAGYYSDLFMMISQMDQPGTTAREIVERHEEKLLMLGPVLERLESELLDPLIDRTFSIMLEKGLIPVPPPELQGMEMKVEYISMLAQAQKMVGTGAIAQTLGFVSNLAAVIPNAVDMINVDEAIIEYGDMMGVPPKIIRSKEDVAVIRKNREDAQIAAEQTAALQNTIAGAKTMADTKLGQNSALDLAGKAMGIDTGAQK